jgi:hypothetical protein
VHIPKLLDFWCLRLFDRTSETAALAKPRAHLAGEAISALVRRHQRGIRSLPLTAVSRPE